MSDDSTGEKLFYCKICHHGPFIRTVRFCPSPTCRQPTAGNLRPWPPPELEPAPPTQPQAARAPVTGGSTGTDDAGCARLHPQATSRDGGLALRFPFGDVPVGRELRIGRESTFSAIADQLAAWDNVSREHAVIRVQDGCCTIADFSSNGTWVNDVKLAYDEPVPLQAGDRVRFAARLIADVVEGPTP